MSIGTRRRLTVLIVALSGLAPAALIAQPAAAFPHDDPVSTFNDKFVATARIAKLKQTISPQAGTFKGRIDSKTGQLKGVIALPSARFADQPAGLMTATAAIVPIKPVTGHWNRSNSRITATSTFVLHIVTASTSTTSHVAHSASDLTANVRGTLPTLPITLPTIPITLPTLPTTLPTVPVTLPTVPSTLPPINMVGNACSTAPITMTLTGIAHAGSLSKLTGEFTIPDFTTCGSLTALLNTLLAGPGNTFAATAAPASPPSPTLPCTLPTLPVTLPTLPVTLPVTLPTLPCTLPLPTLPAVNP
ncbi:MAG: hypothetical protein ACLPVY_04020 [Acidimicrobiia bacterium]